MKRKLLPSKLIIFSLFLFCATCFHSFGQQTKKISLQGFLKDANGKAVADTKNYDITFKLYTTLTGGTAAWTEVTKVDVIGGVYSTYLGSTPTNPIDGLSWGTSTYFVGVTIGGVELTPRTELTFAPYSLGSPFADRSRLADLATNVVCSGAVGDVKYSILNPQQFAAQNGNCWVPMDGGSMAGSKLAGIIGGSNVPNAGGLFLRGQESQNGTTNYDADRSQNDPIATYQGDSYGSHNHNYSLNASGYTSTDGAHTHKYYRVSGYNDRNDGGDDHDNPNRNGFDTDTDSKGSHSHSFNVAVTGTISSAGGNETRPKNLNLWTYIRIN